ncbi:MAG: ThuA domain-containing protein [Flavobacteriaceae bacterium]|nr:ThuA domain-containing protein [Flavobacteriaceae bacterium]
MRNHFFFILFYFFVLHVSAQNLDSFDVTEEWLKKIESLAPDSLRFNNVSKKRILVFSKATGFEHWIIPHNIEMLKILAQKTKGFEINVGYDIGNFTKENLETYDAIILNNSNPQGPERDLFADLLKQNTSMSVQKINKVAPQYERNLIEYVANGGGLMILHGAISVQNNSAEFSAMVGGSFDYHPKQQTIHLKEVDVYHPLVSAFNGQGLTHIDEPYFFKQAYFEYNFRPLLYMSTRELDDLTKEPHDDLIYVAWIKRHGEGRVFYTAPSHNAQSLENPELLQFFLDGIQYVLGDLECDDTPI